MNTKFRLGILINPVAGIGGPAGLKGSDAPETQRIAKERGVESKVHARVKEVLALLSDEADRIELILPSSQMGEIALPAEHSFSYSIAYSCAQHTTADDTVRAANALCERGLDLLLFAGGDGTARDVFSAIGNTQAVLGIPAGVKMHSGVFAVTPRAVASVVKSLLSASLVSASLHEVRDIDEKAFSEGRVETRFFGEMLVPDDQLLVQQVKCSGLSDDALMLEELAAYIAELADDDSLWILGSGGTLKTIKSHIGVTEPTLLGVDLWHQGECVVKDAHEAQVFEWLGRCAQAKLVLSVIGGQGIVLGRGNQQISPRVIEAVGIDNLMLVSTQKKLHALEGRPLMVDSGSAELDARLSGYHRVLCGYEDVVLYRVGLPMDNTGLYDNAQQSDLIIEDKA